MNRMECERSGKGMPVKLAKLGLISKRTWQTVSSDGRQSAAHHYYRLLRENLSHFGFGKLYTNVTHEILNITAR